MKDALVRLIKVKTILTLILGVVFAILSIRGDVTAQQFITIFSVVIGFYFGTQHEKDSKDKEDSIDRISLD